LHAVLIGQRELGNFRAYFEAALRVVVLGFDEFLKLRGCDFFAAAKSAQDITQDLSLTRTRFTHRRLLVKASRKGNCPPLLQVYYNEFIAKMNQKAFAPLMVVAALSWIASAPAFAASDLHLAPDLSFTDDSSSNFPIAGDSIGDATIATDRATIMFFGTAHCWNTNREAERLVALYPKYRDRIDFVIVDVDHPSAPQQALMAKYYRGFIPTIAVVDRKGEIIYDRAGETASTRGDTAELETLLNSAK
jgi:hypothetical protein